MNLDFLNLFEVMLVLVFFLVIILFSFFCVLGRQCDDNETGTLTITTTTVSLVSRPNCTLSSGDNIHGNGSLTGLTSGAVYQIFMNCFNCCKEITTSKSVYLVESEF